MVNFKTSISTQTDPEIFIIDNQRVIELENLKKIDFELQKLRESLVIQKEQFEGQSQLFHEKIEQLND